MTNLEIHHIADFFVKVANEESKPLTRQRLLKLVYLTQVTQIKETGYPAFLQDVMYINTELVNGRGILEIVGLENIYPENALVPITSAPHVPSETILAELDQDTQNTVLSVWATYGSVDSLTLQELIEQSDAYQFHTTEHHDVWRTSGIVRITASDMQFIQKQYNDIPFTYDANTVEHYVGLQFQGKNGTYAVIENEGDVQTVFTPLDPTRSVKVIPNLAEKADVLEQLLDQCTQLPQRLTFPEMEYYRNVV